MNREKLGQRGGEYLVRLLRMPIEVLFLVIFLFFGLVFVAVIPLGWNTDEANHIYRIYQLSAGNLFSEKVIDRQANVKAYGGDVPTNLVRLFDKTGANMPGGLGNPANKLDSHLYVHQTSILTLKDDGSRTSAHFSGAALYSPVTYAIYIPLFWIGKLLSLPFFWIIILCRLAGILLTGLAFYLAIKYMPVGKWIFFAVGLMPSVLVQAQSVGADAPQLAVCILFIMAIVRLLYIPRKLRWPDYTIFATLGIALALIKLVYAPMLLLLLALPLVKKNYRDRRTILLLSAVIIMAIIPCLVWSHLVAYVDINSNPQADFAAQKLFILHQPFMYARTLYYTFLTNQQPALDNLFGSFIALPAVYTYLGSAILVLSLFVKNRREVTARVLSKTELKLWRWALAAISLVTIVLIATALYVYSTTLRQSSIVGIQSRYFLPVLPLVLLIFYGNTVKNQRAVKMGIIIMSCVVLIGAVLAIYFRLYQTPALIITALPAPHWQLLA